MRILLIGTVEFSEKALRFLHRIGAHLVGVVTMPDTGINADFADLKTTAEELHLPCLTTRKINSAESIVWMKERQPDIIFCFGWSRLLGPDVLSLTPKGVIGFHPTLLPANRGRHPLIWAKVLGLKESGCTFFQMDAGADTGPILAQAQFDIVEEDDARSLYTKMTDCALPLLQHVLESYARNTLNPRSQNPEAGNTWRKRSMPDGYLDFRMHTQTLLNVVRALTKPYVGAHVLWNQEVLSIWKAERGPSDVAPNLEPGKILQVIDDRILVKTADASIWLTQHDFKELPQAGNYF